MNTFFHLHFDWLIHDAIVLWLVFAWTKISCIYGAARALVFNYRIYLVFVHEINIYFLSKCSTDKLCPLNVIYNSHDFVKTCKMRSAMKPAGVVLHPFPLPLFYWFGGVFWGARLRPPHFSSIPTKYLFAAVVVGQWRCYDMISYRYRGKKKRSQYP